MAPKTPKGPKKGVHGFASTAGKTAIKKIKPHTNKAKKTGVQTLGGMSADSHDRKVKRQVRSSDPLKNAINERMEEKADNEGESLLAKIMDPNNDNSWAANDCSSDEYYDTDRSTSDESDLPDMDEDAEEREGIIEIEDGNGNIIEQDCQVNYKEVEEAMRGKEPTANRWAAYKKHKQIVKRIGADAADLKHQVDGEEIEDIAEWDEGGYYDLVLDPTGNIEGMSAGIYRDRSTQSIMQRYAPSRKSSGGRIIDAVPVKILIAPEEKKVAIAKLLEKQAAADQAK